jgi:hypothetical protein
MIGQEEKRGGRFVAAMCPAAAHDGFGFSFFFFSPFFPVLYLWRGTFHWFGFF